ncbi:DUF4232 domain-containing protein [Phytohabitans houttuyneae]|uniref:DUF4232 domain-containing protein n=1 Tax=Phytohabitans houttuyneae TaxID=1076126 RepID=A0A6V8KJJ3_9ACTN|nr:DUF4232 domain-containing protein [Phytohabitans houttuyneae]GFJ84034.1 hypothetical protein Phou_082140 [Phytohabitans houttuyneae]
MERAPRPWMWPLIRLAVGVALAAPVAVVAIGALAGDGGGGGEQPSARALPSRTAPSPSPPHSPAPAACPQSGLSVRPGGAEAAMGLRVLQIVVTNCGAVPRTLHGHPAVRLLDEDRGTIDVAATPGSSGIATVPSFDAAATAVTLRPGERAMTALLWRNTVTDASVRATLGRYVQVAVADGAPSQVIEPDGGIDLGNTGKLGVAPWVAYR